MLSFLWKHTTNEYYFIKIIHVYFSSCNFQVEKDDTCRWKWTNWRWVFLLFYWNPYDVLLITGQFFVCLNIGLELFPTIYVPASVWNDVRFLYYLLILCILCNTTSVLWPILNIKKIPQIIIRDYNIQGQHYWKCSNTTEKHFIDNIISQLRINYALSFSRINTQIYSFQVSWSNMRFSEEILVSIHATNFQYSIKNCMMIYLKSWKSIETVLLLIL